MSNLYQGLSGDLTKTIAIDRIYPENSGKIVKATTRVSARELHKYVMGLVGVFVMILITYPMAIDRVTQQGKFTTERSHVKSLSLEYQPLEPN